MNDEAIAALHAWIADRETYVMPPLGDAQFSRTLDGPVINQADPRIGVTLELAEDAADGLLNFAIETGDGGKTRGVLTISGVNRTVRYRVTAYVLPQNVLVCERIDA